MSHHYRDQPPGTIAIIGGAGKTGSRVGAQLGDRGHRVAVRSRSTDPRFDWADPDTYRTALAGVDAAYISYYPDISFPAAAGQLAVFGEVAAASGVRRLVLLSGRGEPEAVPAEDAIRNAGAEWTVLRCAWFMQNFSEHFLTQPVLDGTIALPASDTTEPFVDLDDVAEVAVAALTEPGHGGQTYDLSGPELLSFHDIARELSAGLGRDIGYLPITAAEYGAAALAAGVPEEEIAPLTDLFVRVLDGHNSTLSPDLARVLGRSPGRFADYVARTVRTGVWTGASVGAPT